MPNDKPEVRPAISRLEETTLRDQFAMAALTGWRAAGNTDPEVIDWAYQDADAMLEARNAH